MKKIMWFSQHTPLPVQIEWLDERFGGVEIHQDPNPFTNAQEILRRFRSAGYDDMVVVAPLSVIAKLCELGIKPLWAEMQEVYRKSEADLSYRGRLYRFVTFRRIKTVRMEFEEV